MGQSELKHFMSAKRDPRRRRRRIESPDGLIASRGKRKCSPCQQDCVPQEGSTSDLENREEPPCQLDDTCQTGETDVYSALNLPEEMWRHIHSLMPLRDAARAACVSQSFRCSWRCHPNLILSRKMLGFDEDAPHKETARDFRNRIDYILRNHSGIGVRKLNLSFVPNYNTEDRCYLDGWLKMAVTPAIEELSLSLSILSRKYKLCDTFFEWDWRLAPASSSHRLFLSSYSWTLLLEKPDTTRAMHGAYYGGRVMEPPFQFVSFRAAFTPVLQ